LNPGIDGQPQFYDKQALGSLPVQGSFYFPFLSYKIILFMSEPTYFFGHKIKGIEFNK
jgi:hypothetical protein